jgi:HEPN domain-containing protein
LTNDEIARAHLRQAEVILAEARSLLKREAWNLVVRRAQEAVELSLKAALRAVGVEVPRLHDVGATLKSHASRLPESSRSHLGALAEISRRLAREREMAFYGDEQSGTAPQALYSEGEAARALSDAEFVVGWSRHLLISFQ